MWHIKKTCFAMTIILVCAIRNCRLRKNREDNTGAIDIDGLDYKFIKIRRVHLSKLAS